MRFNNPQNGDIIIRKKFLFFPKTIKNETRWLEFAEWKKIFVCYPSNHWENPAYWSAIEWINK